MPVYSTKWDKINLVATHLMSGPDCGWLFLVGTGGGEGKTMASWEALKLWRMSLGEDVNDPITDSQIVMLRSYSDGEGHKMVLMKKDTPQPVVKTIVHINGWTPAWEFMAKEWNATVVRFERGNEPR